jgi:hypothetical protein
MPVVECSNCGRKLRVPEGFKGARCRCPHCHGVFDYSPTPPVDGAQAEIPLAHVTEAEDRVPAEAGSAEVGEEDEGAGDYFGREITETIRRRRRRTPKVLIAAAIIAMGAVLVFLVSAAIYWRIGERGPGTSEEVAPEGAATDSAGSRE